VEAKKIAGQENAAKAETQGYRHDQKECAECFWEFLEALAPDDFQ